MNEFVVKEGKTYLKIRVSNVFDTVSVQKFTISDVVEYFATQARNITSGCRVLGGLAGDWRPVDELAHYCLEYFKSVNIKELRRVSKQFGLTPKF